MKSRVKCNATLAPILLNGTPLRAAATVRSKNPHQPPPRGFSEQRKEFLRGFVHEIAIDPDAARGTITFYELPISSLRAIRFAPPPPMGFGRG
jgi:hypothetical protein